jgi:magnesium-protoporphyrin IX monomethyl ester (oxidative) cyclase
MLLLMQMERLFSPALNPTLDLSELQAVHNELRNDYNQNHFVRNSVFQAAVAGMDSEARKTFVTFLERATTTEFSGFLLFKVGHRVVLNISKQQAAAQAAAAPVAF